MDYRKAAIRPADCLRGGWEVVKDRYWLFVGIVSVGLVIGSLAPLGLFMGPMVCGIYACLLARMRGAEISFRTLFGGFEHFVQSFVATLIQIVPIMAMMVPVNLLLVLLFLKRLMVRMPQPYPRLAEMLGPSEMALVVVAATLVIFLLSVFFGTFFMFSYPLIVDRRLSGWQSVKLSARASRENFGGAAALMAVTTLVSVVGSLVCYVGGLLVTPVTLAAWAVAYRSVFPADGGEPHRG
jgi:hypothetical protein